MSVFVPCSPFPLVGSLIAVWFGLVWSGLVVVVAEGRANDDDLHAVQNILL
jgi:hypothetical protein